MITYNLYLKPLIYFTLSFTGKHWDSRGDRKKGMLGWQEEWKQRKFVSWFEVKPERVNERKMMSRFLVTVQTQRQTDKENFL